MQCWTRCRSASWCSPAPGYRKISPARPGSSAFRYGCLAVGAHSPHDAIVRNGAPMAGDIAGRHVIPIQLSRPASPGGAHRAFTPTCLVATEADGALAMGAIVAV